MPIAGGEHACVHFADVRASEDNGKDMGRESSFELRFSTIAETWHQRYAWQIMGEPTMLRSQS